jgi:hypothetical protein
MRSLSCLVAKRETMMVERRDMICYDPVGERENAHMTYRNRLADNMGWLWTEERL